MVKKKTRFRLSKNILIRFAVLVFAGYVLFAFFSTQLEISKEKKRLQELRAKSSEAALVGEEMQALLNSADKDSYFERLARELGFVFPDERVYIDISGK